MSDTGADAAASSSAAQPAASTAASVAALDQRANAYNQTGHEHLIEAAAFRTMAAHDANRDGIDSNALAAQAAQREEEGRTRLFIAGATAALRDTFARRWGKAS